MDPECLDLLQPGLPPGKSQVAIHFLRNAGTDPPLLKKVVRNPQPPDEICWIPNAYAKW